MRGIERNKFASEKILCIERKVNTVWNIHEFFQKNHKKEIENSKDLKTQKNLSCE